VPPNGVNATPRFFLVSSCAECWCAVFVRQLLGRIFGVDWGS